MTEQLSVYEQVGGLKGVTAVTERVFTTMRNERAEAPHLWHHFEGMEADQLAMHVGLVAGALSFMLGADRTPVTPENLVDWHRDVQITQEELAAFGGIVVRSCEDLGADSAIPLIEGIVPLLQQTLVEKEVS